MLRETKRERIAWETNTETCRKHPSKGCQNRLPPQSLVEEQELGWALTLSSFIASKKNTDMPATVLYEKQPQNASANTSICIHYLTCSSPVQKFRSISVLWFWYSASMNFQSQCHQGCHHLKAWLSLGDLHPKWFMLKAIGKRPQFLTYTNCPSLFERAQMKRSFSQSRAQEGTKVRARSHPVLVALTIEAE